MQEQSYGKEKTYSRRRVTQLLAAAALGITGIASAPNRAAAKAPESQKKEELLNTRKVIVKGLSPGITVTSVGPAWEALGPQTSQGDTPLIFESVPCANDELAEYGGIYIYDDGDKLANIRGKEGQGGIYIPVYRSTEGDDLVLDFSLESPGLGYYQLNIHRFLEETKKDNRESSAGKIKIAVIDSGIDIREPTMAKYIEGGVINMSGQNEINKKINYLGDPHGISVCDVIARYGPPNVEIFPIAITSSDEAGKSTREQVIRAVKWCMDNGIQLVNLSWQFSPSRTSYDFQENANTLEALLVEANKKGTYIIGSAGNNGKEKDSTYYASGSLKNIRVGAMGNGGTVVAYSSDGPHVLGPTAIQAATLNTENGYPDKSQRGIFTGTSAASPAVLAVAANMSAFCPEAPMGTILEAMQRPECTTDIYSANSEKNIRDGKGIVDALKLYQYLKSVGY